MLYKKCIIVYNSKLYFGHCEDYFLKYLHESNYENRAKKHIIESKTHISYPTANLGNLRLPDYRKHAIIWNQLYKLLYYMHHWVAGFLLY